MKVPSPREGTQEENQRQEGLYHDPTTPGRSFYIFSVRARAGREFATVGPSLSEHLALFNELLRRGVEYRSALAHDASPLSESEWAELRGLLSLRTHSQRSADQIRRLGALLERCPKYGVALAGDVDGTDEEALARVVPAYVREWSRLAGVQAEPVPSAAYLDGSPAAGRAHIFAWVPREQGRTDLAWRLGALAIDAAEAAGIPMSGVLVDPNETRRVRVGDHGACLDLSVHSEGAHALGRLIRVFGAKREKDGLWEGRAPTLSTLADLGRWAPERYLLATGHRADSRGKRSKGPRKHRQDPAKVLQHGTKALNAWATDLLYGAVAAGWTRHEFRLRLAATMLDSGLVSELAATAALTAATGNAEDARSAVSSTSRRMTFGLPCAGRGYLRRVFGNSALLRLAEVLAAENPQLTCGEVARGCLGLRSGSAIQDDLEAVAGLAPANIRCGTRELVGSGAARVAHAVRSVVTCGRLCLVPECPCGGSKHGRVMYCDSSARCMSCAIRFVEAQEKAIRDLWGPQARYWTVSFSVQFGDRSAFAARARRAYVTCRTGAPRLVWGLELDGGAWRVAAAGSGGASQADILRGVLGASKSTKTTTTDLDGAIRHLMFGVVSRPVAWQDLCEGRHAGRGHAWRVAEATYNRTVSTGGKNSLAWPSRELRLAAIAAERMAAIAAKHPEATGDLAADLEVEDSCDQCGGDFDPVGWHVDLVHNGVTVVESHEQRYGYSHYSALCERGGRRDVFASGAWEAPSPAAARAAG